MFTPKRVRDITTDNWVLRAVHTDKIGCSFVVPRLHRASHVIVGVLTESCQAVANSDNRVLTARIAYSLDASA